MKSEDRSGRRRVFVGYQCWIPAAILTLGAFGTAMLLWMYQINEKQRVEIQHIDAVMGLEIRAALFHLWFEEAVTRGTREDAERTLPDVDAAMQLAQALLQGGTSEAGTELPPLDALRFREGVGAIGSGLAELKEIAFKRYEDPGAGGIGSDLDEQFDSIFNGILKSARAIAAGVEQAKVKDYDDSKRLLFAVIGIWVVIVAAATLGLHNRELRRGEAELASSRAFEEMEQRVRDRTHELQDANEQLHGEIADRMRAEESLRESEEGFKRLSVQFRTLLDTLPDAVTLLSRDMEVLWANRVADALAPSGVEMVAGKRCNTLWQCDSNSCEECPASTSFRSGKPAEARISGKGGRHWDIRAVPVISSEDGVVESVLAVATDITEKVILQAETVRAGQLASLGELSAGVAHEVNNPINGIINYAQVLRNKSLEGSREHDIAGRILKEGNRIARILQGLLAFARERKEPGRPVELEYILTESLALISSQMSKEGIRIITEVPADLPDIVANPQQIQQVFLNIMSNARYALNHKFSGPHENKILDIRGERISTGGAPHVRITFLDHGTGIPDRLLPKIMDPFFSTKPSGKGTGLGLSISHGIISDHGGKLSVESVEGEFARVIVDLPAREKSNVTNPRD